MKSNDSRGEINYFRIPVDENSYSLLQIGSSDFPVHLSYDNLTDYENCFVNWHKQKEIEISLVADGALHVCLPGYSKIFRKGDVFIIFPDALHSIKKVEHTACEYRTLLFDPAFLCGYPGSFWDQAFYRPLTQQNLSIADFSKQSHASLLNELNPLLNTNTETLQPLEQMQMQHKLQEIWVRLFHNSSAYDNMNHPQNPLIPQMLLFLHQHYADRFSLDELSAEVNLSRSECCRKFKKNMNMTLVEYLTEYRIGKAMELLEHSTLSMTEIANRTGFSGASNFSMLFHKKIGVTPLQYKKQHHSLS